MTEVKMLKKADLLAENQEACEILGTFTKEDIKAFCDYAEKLFASRSININIFELRSVMNQLKDGKQVEDIANMPSTMNLLIMTTVRHWHKQVRTTKK